MALQNHDISYIKPGMAVGGATMADVEMIKLFSEMGRKVDVNVGYVDERIQLKLYESGFEISVNPIFDREKHLGRESRSGMHLALKSIIDSSKLTIISQSFLGDAPVFNETLSELLDKRNVGVQWLRSHDHVRDAGFFKMATQNGRLLSLPTTKAMEEYMLELSPSANTEVLPYFISKENYIRQSSDVSSKEVRERLGISQEDFVILQPSRVDPRKRVGKSVALAASLQEAMPERRVVLLVAGGAELVEAHKREKSRLERLATKLDFKNVIYLNGLTGDGKYRRMSDYLRRGVADVVTFMSEIDAFGLPPLECSIAGVPCVTSAFKDEKGFLSFGYNYPGFSFLVDDCPDDMIENSTISNVLKIANGSVSMDTEIENNMRLAEELYGEQAMRENLNRLLSKYNV